MKKTKIDDMRKEGGLLRWMRQSSGSFNKRDTATKSDGTVFGGVKTSFDVGDVSHCATPLSQEPGQSSSSKEMAPAAVEGRDLLTEKQVTRTSRRKEQKQPKPRKVYRVGARPILVDSQQLRKIKSTPFADNGSSAVVERIIYKKLTDSRRRGNQSSSSLPTIQEAASSSLETSHTTTELSSSNSRSGDSHRLETASGHAPTFPVSDFPVIPPLRDVGKSTFSDDVDKSTLFDGEGSNIRVPSPGLAKGPAEVTHEATPTHSPFPSLTYSKRGWFVEDKSLDSPVAPTRTMLSGEDQKEVDQMYSARIEDFDAVLYSSAQQLFFSDSPGLSDSSKSLSEKRDNEVTTYFASPVYTDSEKEKDLERRVHVDNSEEEKRCQSPLHQTDDESAAKSKRSSDGFSTPVELTQKESDFLTAVLLLHTRPDDLKEQIRSSRSSKESGDMATSGTATESKNQTPPLSDSPGGVSAVPSSGAKIRPKHQNNRQVHHKMDSSKTAAAQPADAETTSDTVSTVIPETHSASEDDTFRHDVKSFVHDYVLENPGIVDNALEGSVESLELEQSQSSVVIICDIQDPLADLNMRTMKTECYDAPAMGSNGGSGTEDSSRISAAGGDSSSSIRSRSSSIPSRSASLVSKYSLAPDVAADLYDNLYSSSSVSASFPSSPVPSLPPPPKLPRYSAYPNTQQEFATMDSLVGFDSDDGTDLKDNTRLTQDPNYRHSLKHIHDCIWAALGDDECEELDLGNNIRIDKDSAKAIKEESDDHMDSSTIADDEEEGGWLSTEDPWSQLQEENASYTTDEAVIFTIQQGQKLLSAKDIIRAAQERLRIERSQSLMDDGDDPLESTQPRRNTSDRSRLRSRYADASERSGQSEDRSARDRSRRSRDSADGAASSGRDSSRSSYGSYLTAPRRHSYYEASSSADEEEDDYYQEEDDFKSQYGDLGAQYAANGDGDEAEDDQLCEGYNASADLAEGEMFEDEMGSAEDCVDEMMLVVEETAPPPTLPYSNDAVVEYNEEDIDDDVSSLGSHLTVLVNTARRRQELQLEKERVEVELKKLELKDATRRRNLLMPATLSTAQRLVESSDDDNKSPPPTKPPRKLDPFPLAEISGEEEGREIERPEDEEGDEKSIYDNRDEHPSPVSVSDFAATSNSSAPSPANEEWDRCNRQVQEMRMYPPKLHESP